jgi:quercetin dioxygenase-like cupin family protein
MDTTAAGEPITDRPEREVRLLADLEELGASWSRYGPGERGPEAHVHREHTDSFYVLDGELTFELGCNRARVVAPAGALIAVPPGVVHSFGNESERDACFLNLHTPGVGFGDYLRGGKHDFDQHDPPADGGPPASTALVQLPG